MNTETEKQYLLLFRGDDWHNRISAEETEAAMAKFQKWFEGLSQRGILRGAQPLGPEGKIVSGKNGRVVADGPFAESKETIGGYFLVAVDSLDEAVAIAQSNPALEYGGRIEVRPVAEECPLTARARQGASEREMATV